MKYLGHVIRIVTGMYQEEYNKDWDAKLNELLDKHWESASLSQNGVVLRLGVWQVWVGNKWYAYGHSYYVADKYISREFQYRPKMSTMIRLDKLVKFVKAKEKLENDRVHKNILATTFNLDD